MTRPRERWIGTSAQERFEPTAQFRVFPRSLWTVYPPKQKIPRTSPALGSNCTGAGTTSTADVTFSKASKVHAPSFIHAKRTLKSTIPTAVPRNARGLRPSSHAETCRRKSSRQRTRTVGGASSLPTVFVVVASYCTSFSPTPCQPRHVGKKRTIELARRQRHQPHVVAPKDDRCDSFGGSHKRQSTRSTGNDERPLPG